MKVTIFGATGALGRECLQQCLDAGHEVTALVRSPAKLPAEVREQINIVEGDCLDPGSVSKALERDTNGVLFAIGVDKGSREDLCTHATRNILNAMRDLEIRRFVWCGGGSNLVDDDQVTLGARFVEFFARTFMSLKHRDKTHQLELLAQSPDIDWLGVRPLQMRNGKKRGKYRVGFDRFSGLSVIHFADCADSMIAMLEDDTWIHKAPIIQY
ncbi:MAG: NAD(P)H-binding protein [Myxococcota bacterium]